MTDASRSSHPLSTRGGCRIGLANVTWPFVKLDADHERLRITVLGLKTYALALSEVERIEPASGVISPGVRIRGNANADFPPSLVFWTFEQTAVLAGLRRLGYPVS